MFCRSTQTRKKMNAFTPPLSVITIFFLLHIPLDAKILTIQADFQRNKENHPVRNLSNASNGKAIILEPTRTLSLNFCLREKSRVAISDLRFSNGNNSELVVVDIDGESVGIFQTPTNRSWNDFVSTHGFMDLQPGIGWHYLRIRFNGTADGIAIDKVDLYISDERLTEDIFSCELSCIADQRFNLRANNMLTESSFIVQESYKTLCPEVDNINVPIFNPNVQTYEITAALPRYRTFSNWRGENTTGCPHLSPIYWRFDNELLLPNRRVIADKVYMYFSAGRDLYSRVSLHITLQFKLEGKSMGMVDSEMGTILKMRFKNLKSNVRVAMSIKGRTHKSRSDVKLVTPTKPITEWNTPDFSWTDQGYNLIFLDIDSNSSTPLVLEYLFLERRPWLADQIKVIHKDDNIIVEAVFSDFWWLYPDAMTIHLSNGAVFHNTSYFRIYRPIPWNSGYAQVFVLYQDGNARLLPIPPEGVDWIPFGSSVIIGQTDPTVVRPYASITDVWIDIDKLIFDLRYKNGGTSKLTLICTLSETRVVVSDILFRGNTLYYPFATFRSMYVEEGNSDVDHVSVDGMFPRHIMEDFEAVMGRNFVFHRKCMSRHLNLSPDIYIDIRRTKNDTQIEFFYTESFNALIARIQAHRYRLWTPRLRNHD